MKTTEMLIDTHCHLDHFVKNGSLEAILDRAQQADVQKIIAVGTTPEDSRVNLDLAARYPGQIYATVGLHPSYVDENWSHALALQAELLQKAPIRPVALGEIGLDFYRLPDQDPDQAQRIQTWQREAFRAQLRTALSENLPIIVHARAAFRDVCQILDEMQAPWKRVVFHCFSEGPEEILYLKSKGARASFTGIVSYKNADLVRQALRAHTLDSLMVETDAPWLAPDPYRGRANEPAFVCQVAQACAAALEMPFSVVEKATTEHAQAFFNLH